MGKKYINGYIFHAQICPTVTIARRSAELISTSKLEIIERVNEETEFYPSLDIKAIIYPTGIFRVDLMNR